MTKTKKVHITLRQYEIDNNIYSYITHCTCSCTRTAMTGLLPSSAKWIGNTVAKINICNDNNIRSICTLLKNKQKSTLNTHWIKITALSSLLTLGHFNLPVIRLAEINIYKPLFYRLLYNQPNKINWSDLNTVLTEELNVR